MLATRTTSPIHSVSATVRYMGGFTDWLLRDRPTEEHQLAGKGLNETMQTERSENENEIEEQHQEIKTVGKYQRIEEWDAQLKEEMSELSWEERVKFDGQRFGNQLKQDAILRHHLHK